MKQSEQTVEIQFDRFRIPVHVSTLRGFILDEIKRLSEASKLPGDKLPVHFRPLEQGVIACFVFCVRDEHVIPESFCFSISMLNGMSAHQITGIVRHEFAHYVRSVRYGVPSVADGHDAKWKQICRQLGCIPEAAFVPHVTQLF